MIRLFDEHIVRRVSCLDGAWRFRADRNKEGVADAWFASRLDGDTVWVPAVWNNQKEFFAYEGAAWYERDFYFEGGTLKLTFGAVMTEADVWLDGKHLGNHYGGFCQFDFTVGNVEAGWHRVTLRVDNSFDAQSIPQPFVDWYHFGGIIRSIYAETLTGVSISHHRFDYTLSEDMKKANCTLTAGLYNCNGEKTCTRLSLTVEGDEVASVDLTLEANESREVHLEFSIDDVRLWDLFKPELYNISINTDTDDMRDRVGFRKIEIKDRKILLNGKEVEIMGVNRHEAYPEFGFAFPQNLMARDLRLIKEMNCNFIRGSHYTQSREFVDLLDENGILFWSEIPIWGCGFAEKTLADPVVVERGLNLHREMLKYYYNHPSIVMWGMHNEILSNTQAGYDMSKLYYEYLKENGGNRLVVYASHIPSSDISLEFTDVICLNQYHGWYLGNLESWVGVLDKASARFDSLGLSDKPIIMSEFGAGALYGCHDDESVVWSEEYQAKLISYCLKLFHSRPEIVGSLIWQFCDVRTAKEANLTRARGFNNKGLVSEHRKPKLAYFAAQKCFAEFTEENENG